jgi:SAM-dependent methyltransferase
VAGRHPEPGHPPLLGRLTEAGPGGDEVVARDNSRHYGEAGARWYDAVNSWRTEDLPFYLREAGRWAGPSGSVLELGAGTGRVSLALARGGFRVTALESAPAMARLLRERAAGEPEPVSERLEVVDGDMRRFSLDRLFRFVCLPFNTLLMLPQPHDRQQLLTAVREHLAPSGGFGFDIFTPDPRLLMEVPHWTPQLDFEAQDPDYGTVRVEREHRAHTDLGRQVRHLRFRNRVTAGDKVVGLWEDDLDLAVMFPRELELLLERQGFRIVTRHGGPEGQPYAPTADNVQPMYVVAQLIP